MSIKTLVFLVTIFTIIHYINAVSNLESNEKVNYAKKNMTMMSTPRTKREADLTTTTIMMIMKTSTTPVMGRRKRNAMSTTTTMSTIIGRRKRNMITTTAVVPNGKRKRSAMPVTTTTTTMPHASRRKRQMTTTTTVMPLVNRCKRQMTTTTAMTTNRQKSNAMSTSGDLIANLTTTTPRQKRSAEVLNDQSNSPMMGPVKKFFESLTSQQKNAFFEIKSNPTLTRAQIEEQIEQWADKQPGNLKVI